MTAPDWLTPDPWELEADEQARERRRATWARYRERNRERLRAYQRDRNARLRAEQGIEGYLHELYCTAPHYGVRFYGKHRKCHAIPCYAE
jgi:hypothetical protein